MYTKLLKHTALCSAIVAIGAGYTGVASAQGGPRLVLEEVVVTARKRDESLQDVPMAVSAFNGEALQNSQIDNLVDVGRMTPNVTINETSGLVGGAIQVFVRGIGNDPGLDQGVGIYVDDVYLNRTTGAMLDVFDVERIEILKGPQGNLYGRNTIGGAIKYITREPGEELEYSGEIKAGSDGLFKAKGAVSGPLGDGGLYGGLSFSHKQRDGFQTNTFGGDDPWDAEAQAVRGTLLWTPTDALKFKLAVDYSKDESLPPVPNRVAINAATIGGINFVITGADQIFGPGTALISPAESNDLSGVPSDEDRVSSQFGDGYDMFEIEQTNVAFTATWDLNDYWTLKSVTAGRFMDNVQPFDFDGSNQDFITTVRNLESDDISQEFQFNYSGDSVNGVLGFYYLDGEQEGSSRTLQTPRLRAIQYHDKSTHSDDRTTESLSAYGNFDWSFGNDWQLSVGARYTEDKKTQKQIATVSQGFYALALSPFLPPTAVMAIKPGMEEFVEQSPAFLTWAGNPRLLEFDMPENTDADDEWTEFTPSVKLSYHAGEETLIYAGFATGFKSGGFNTTGGNTIPYDPEIVDSYSLGLKTTLADGSLRLNTELFYNDYTDKQLSSIQLLPDGNLDSLTDNVGEVVTQGLEFEVTWLPPVEGLMFNFNIGYLDVEVDSYESTDRVTGNKIDLSNVTEIGYSPEWTGQIRALYEMQIGDAGWLTLGTDVSYRDELFTTSPVDTTDPLQLAQVSDSHYIWNAMVAYRSADDRWRFALEGKNLTDERVLMNTFDIGIIATGGYNPPRTWAVSVGYTY